ncbi:MAG: SCP2 sterol-binding domain-containing protein [Gammaproteobacteria bacterium]|nr:SCP2 sterol-binding domain-containing protein [Gammaproteobacteria bacterium]
MPKQMVQSSPAAAQQPAALRLARLLAGVTRNGPAAAWFDRLLAMLANRVFALPLASGELDFLSERRLAVEFEDLAVCWVFSLHAGSLRVLDRRARPEVSIRARLADFTALALRRVDADSLFFQQRLAIDGDVALGLMLKNFLDALELDQLAWPAKFALLAGERLLSDARRTSA